MPGMKEIAKNKWRIWLAFLVSFLIPWVFLLMTGAKEQQYDAWVYSELAKAFQEKGLFNFAAYAAANGEAFRGYLLPWIIALCQSVPIPFLNYSFFISLLVAIVSACALPALMKEVFGVETPPWRRPIVAGLTTLLYQGLLSYTLSDLWGIGFAVLAVVALLRAADERPRPLYQRLLFALGCGACLGAAYNIRTIYLVLWLALAAAGVVLAIRRRGLALRARLLWTPVAVIGLLLASLPQMYINMTVYQTPTPLLMGDGASNLFGYQLYNGIYEKKYESNIGVDYWEAGVNYVDNAGMEIMAREGLEATFEFDEDMAHFDGIGDYLEVAFRYPLDFIGIYGRHFINMMDIRYPEIFVEEMEPNALYPTVNYLAMYLSLAAFAAFLLGMEKKRLGKLWYLLCLLLPTFAIMAGAIECRFAIGLQWVLWGCLTALPSRAMIRRLRGREWALLAAGLVVFFCVMTAVGGETMAGFGDFPTLY